MADTRKELFVTGGGSAIGQAVMARLCESHRFVALVHRSPVSLPDGEVECVTGGLEACAAHRERIRAADVVLHLAGLTHSDDSSAYFAVNHEGTCRLLDAMRPDQPMVYISTRCASEQGGAYGHSKLKAEEAIRASGRPFTILRPAEVYGSKGSEGIDALVGLARRFRMLVDFRSRPVVTYAPVSADELAEVIARVVTECPGSGQTYTICNAPACTARDIQQALAEGLGHKVFRVPVPVSGLRFAIRLHLPLPFKRDQLDRLVMDKPGGSQPAHDDLGFTPRPYLDVLRTGEEPL